MDSTQLKYLTDQDRQRYRVLEQLFESDGWKLLASQLEGNVTQFEQRQLTAPTWDAVLYARGARDANAQLRDLPQMVENEFAGRAEEARAAREREDEARFE